MKATIEHEGASIILECKDLTIYEVIEMLIVPALHAHGYSSELIEELLGD